MFVNIGFGNFINSSQIVSICRADSAPMKRMVSEARSKGSAVDATQGRKTKSVILTGSGHLVLSALTRDAYRQITSGSGKDTATRGGRR